MLGRNRLGTTRLGSSGVTSIWDVLDEDFEDITDWVDSDMVNGVSSEDPAGQLCLDTNVAGVPNMAVRCRTLSDLSRDLTLQLKLKMDSLGLGTNWFGLNYTLAVGKGFELSIVASTATRGVVRVLSDGGYSSSAAVVKTNGDADWFWLRVLINYSELICSVYYSEDEATWTRILVDVDCSYTT